MKGFWSPLAAGEEGNLFICPLGGEGQSFNVSPPGQTSTDMSLCREEVLVVCLGPAPVPSRRKTGKNESETRGLSPQTRHTGGRRVAQTAISFKTLRAQEFRSVLLVRVSSQGDMGCVPLSGPWGEKGQKPLNSYGDKRLGGSWVFFALPRRDLLLGESGGSFLLLYRRAVLN